MLWCTERESKSPEQQWERDQHAIVLRRMVSAERHRSENPCIERVQRAFDNREREHYRYEAPVAQRNNKHGEAERDLRRTRPGEKRDDYRAVLTEVETRDASRPSIMREHMDTAGHNCENAEESEEICCHARAAIVAVGARRKKRSSYQAVTHTIGGEDVHCESYYTRLDDRQ